MRLARRVDEWTEADGTGIAFDSSTMFTLSNGAKRSPDASWIRRERWDALPRLKDLQEKMQEYLANGTRLGWLIDPLEKRVYIYRPDQPVEVLDDPSMVRGDPVLPGFVLQVRELW
jgi:Uma2 family endonuclease